LPQFKSIPTHYILAPVVCGGVLKMRQYINMNVYTVVITLLNPHCETGLLA